MNTVLFVNATIGFSANLFLIKVLCGMPGLATVLSYTQRLMLGSMESMAWSSRVPFGQAEYIQYRIILRCTECLDWPHCGNSPPQRHTPEYSEPVECQLDMVIEEMPGRRVT